MANKKDIWLYGLTLAFFLVFTVVLICRFNLQRSKDIKGYAAALTNIVKQENDKIIVLSNQLAIAERENVDLKNTLTDTRNSLESLTGKLTK